MQDQSSDATSQNRLTPLWFMGQIKKGVHVCLQEVHRFSFLEIILNISNGQGQDNYGQTVRSGWKIIL